VEESKNNRFLIALGQLVLDWNFAEGWMRYLLATLAGQDDQISQILTVELGSVGLENALTAFANHILQPEHGDGVLHGVEMYERLRVHRNYYVHGVLVHIDYKQFGIAMSVSAKGKIKQEVDRVDAVRLEMIAAQCCALGDYLSALRSHILGLKQENDEPFPLPNKPPLPEKLAKTPRRPPPHPNQPPT
jgi:hypothetical protein